MQRSNDKAELRRLQIGATELVIIAVPQPRLEHPELSDAELEVINLALVGLSDEQIAERRGTRRRTVANQLRSAYKKLGVNSRFELAAGLAGRDAPVAGASSAAPQAVADDVSKDMSLVTSDVGDG
ncbi:MAG: helix-turn-helix transcriptional regulator [Nannocystaceae bacterium]